MTKPLAVCLLSGGLDSTTSLYVARRDGYEVLALTMLYGQIHKREIDGAKQIATHLNIEHKIVSFGLPWGGSALLDPSIAIPEGRDVSEIGEGIPVTYVPARNTIFLSFAASFAEARGAREIFIGANVLDYSGYPDCRPEFFRRFERVLQQGTKQGVEGSDLEIKTPLIEFTKAEIVKLGRELGVPFECTWSCYKGGDYPCGKCDSCLLREKGFEDAGYLDPLIRGARA